VRSASPAVTLGVAAAATLGCALPLMMVPASKSSPLALGIAALFALFASVSFAGARDAASRIGAALLSPFGIALLLAAALMLASATSAHAPGASLRQVGQLGLVVASGAVLALLLPPVAPRRRAVLFAGSIALAGIVMAVDLSNDLWLRRLTGGRDLPFAYNRGFVTLTLLIWPTLALVIAAKKLWLAAIMILVLPIAVLKGESGSAVVALAAGVAVFPLAAWLPRFTRWLGLATTLAILAIQPWFGLLLQRVLTSGFHETFKSAHSSDRIDIWLSFGAAAQARWLAGSGFGSSLNMQNAPVAALLPPERVTLLAASHPHNAFLQVWVEMGVIGASVAAVLILLTFRSIGRLRAPLQPFALACFAAAALVALVSHGAWQAWWWAAILACVASFAILDRELSRGEPPH
jgi:O-antigen ligase